MSKYLGISSQYANHSVAMESRDHSKNGASLKSHTSKEKLKVFFMKKSGFILTCFIVGGVFAIKVQGQNQNFCFTAPLSTNYLLHKSNAAFDALNDNHYCLRVYFHVLQRNDGTGGQSIQAVHRAYQILNQDYNPHNISFYWDYQIDYINNTTYYSYASSSIFSVNNHSNGIDIYLYGENIGNGGLANGVGNSGEFYVGGNYWNSPYYSLVTSHVISHEMGHVLYLWHTHHGTYNEGGNDNPCPELVNGNNSTTCGDYVDDTPADPHLHFNVNSNTCTWLSSGVDANGSPYNPDTRNIMSYSVPTCMSYFSNHQGERMRNAIEHLPHLQQANIDCSNCKVNLAMKDTPDDVGLEPNNVDCMWESPDIWVRHRNDNGITHQNPEYDPTVPNYVYVRVKNIGCKTSTGTEQLHLYWAKANTALTWSYYWTGGYYFPNNGPLRGSQIGTLTIPILQPSGEIIIPFIWLVPNPVDYQSINTEPWHFCLLARIEATSDPMTYTETSDLGYNVTYNNNIAWKNLSVVDVEPNKSIGAVVAVGNSYRDLVHSFNLSFMPKNPETGKRIFEEAEITAQLDEILYDAWKKGGKISENISELKERTVLIKGENATLNNLVFEPNEVGILNLRFNFLTKEITDKEEYTYRVVQTDASTNKVVGGETYLINKYPRSLFYADAGENIAADKNETIVFSAEHISEPAVYNWYDQSGTLIHEGADFTTSVTIAQKYKLEVIALADGYKDYAEVGVTLNPNKIETIYPNPASNQITISYKLNDAENAYISVANYYYLGISDNYILDMSTSSTTFNISHYPSGIYTITLICNGQITDTKIFVKQ